MNLADATITQLLIPIDDFERGVAFYRDLLGLRLLFAAAPQMAFFQCGAVRLLVGVTPAGQKVQRGSAIYFGLKDIQAVYASLADQGVQFKASIWRVDRRPPALLRRALEVEVRASKGIRLVVPKDPNTTVHRPDPAHREDAVLFVDPLGPPLDRRHHRHRLGARQGPSPRRRPRTSTTCSSTSTRCCAAAAREDVEGVYAGLRPLLDGRVRADLQAEPRAHGRRARAGPGGGRRRQVDDLPRDGARRDRRRRPRPGRARVPPSATPSSRRWSAPTASRPCGTGAARSPPSTACTSRASSTCCAATARGSRSCSRWCRREPELGEAAAGRRRLPRGRGALRRHARGRAAPRRRARPPYPHLDRGVGPRRSRPPVAARLMAGHARLGRDARGPRDRALPAARRRRARARRSSPTTRRPTWSGRAPRTSSRRNSRARGAGRRLRGEHARCARARVDVLARDASLRGEREDIDAVPFEPATVIRMHRARGPFARRSRRRSAATGARSGGSASAQR